MQELESEGRTVEEAITAGLAQMACPRAAVDIKILSEGAAGLFGLMGAKPARVRIARRTDAAPSPATTPEAGHDLAFAQERARELAAGMIERMGARVTSSTTALIAGRVMVEVSSPDRDMLIGRGGQTLGALETVLNAMLAQDARTRIKVRLDIDKYRQQRDEELQTLAAKIAAEVRGSGAIHRFEPMSSQDRRVLHLAFKTFPGIESYSEGEGAARTVAVKPADPSS